MRNTLHGISKTIFDASKLDKAVKRLSAMCDDSGEQIIQELLDYEALPFIDLLIKTGMDQEELKAQLGDMVDAGLLRLKQQYYQPEYELNIPKLDRVIQLARILAC